ncbi:MAG TPA: autotransporter domain-containing protein [Hyphomicrobiaceae bacterium]
MGAGTATGGGFGGTVDVTAPRVASIIRQNPATSPTNADSLTWRITFDENVQNVNAADFTVAGTTATVTSVATVTASTVFDVTVSGGDLASLNATVTLGLAAGQDIQDTAGNALTNTAPTGTNNNTYVMINAADMSVDLSGLPTTATVGTPYSGTIKCTNSAGATASAASATCSVSGLPAGLSLGACSPVPPATVAAGASITCPVSGTPTSAGSATVIVTTGASNDFTTGNNTGSATINPVGTAGLTLTTTASPAMFSGVGQTIVFAYVVTNSGNVTVTGLSVTDTKVSPIGCAATTLAAGSSTTCTGSYTTTAADVNATSIVSTATARATFAGTAVASAAVTTTVKIDVEAVRKATKSAIQSFMSQRANMIASMGPDTGQMHNKLTGSLFGGTGQPNDQPSGLGGPKDEARVQRPPSQPGPQMAAGLGMREALAGDRDAMAREAVGTGGTRPAASALGFSGAADDGQGRFAFATSLTQVRAAATAEQARKEAAASDLPEGMMSLGARGAYRQAPSPQPRFDVWTEGVFSYYSQDRIDGKRQGHAGIFFAGADYLVHPGLLIGALVQIDWMDESSSTLGRNADGRGWMAGPYLSARLTQNLYFDARALWGRSSNHIDPLGAYTDSFETNRALAAAKLTGRWAFGGLTFQPSAELLYFTEEQEAYRNAIGIAIDSQSVRLGRLMFGPEIGYRFAAGGGSVVEPFVGLKGVWDFAKTDETTAAGEPVGREAWRGRVETGATFRSASGISVRAQGSYDGIGDANFHAWQGRATLVVPLQ